jgi:hypothetical protein
MKWILISSFLFVVLLLSVLSIAGFEFMGS